VEGIAGRHAVPDGDRCVPDSSRPTSINFHNREQGVRDDRLRQQGLRAAERKTGAVSRQPASDEGVRSRLDRRGPPNTARGRQWPRGCPRTRSGDLPVRASRASTKTRGSSHRDHYQCCGANMVLTAPAALTWSVAHAVAVARSGSASRRHGTRARVDDAGGAAGKNQAFSARTLLITGVVIAAVGVGPGPQRRASRWCLRRCCADHRPGYLSDYPRHRVINGRERTKGQSSRASGSRDGGHDAAAAARRSSLGCGCCCPGWWSWPRGVGVIRYPDLHRTMPSPYRRDGREPPVSRREVRRSVSRSVIQAGLTVACCAPSRRWCSAGPGT